MALCVVVLPTPNTYCKGSGLRLCKESGGTWLKHGLLLKDDTFFLRQIFQGALGSGAIVAYYFGG